MCPVNRALIPRSDGPSVCPFRSARGQYLINVPIAG